MALIPMWISSNARETGRWTPCLVFEVSFQAIQVEQANLTSKFTFCRRPASASALVSLLLAARGDILRPIQRHVCFDTIRSILIEIKN